MLAPINSPREIYASAQLAARDFFGPVDDVERFPRSFVVVRSADGEAAPRARHPTVLTVASAIHGQPCVKRSGGRAWDGVKILEFGSGAAGPIATRYFAEHGATVLRVESKSRPDFLRVYALGPEQSARTRRRADVRRAQRRQAQRDAQPETARRGRARAPARRRVGRRRRRELRAAGHEGLRTRLRRARRRSSPISSWSVRA